MSGIPVKNLSYSSGLTVPMSLAAGAYGLYLLGQEGSGGTTSGVLLCTSAHFLITEIKNTGFFGLPTKTASVVSPLFNWMKQTSAFQKISGWTQSTATSGFQKISNWAQTPIKWLSAKSPLTNAERLTWGTIGGAAGAVVGYGSDAMVRYAIPAVVYSLNFVKTGALYGGTQLIHWANYATEETLNQTAQAYKDVKYVSDSRAENIGLPWFPLIAGGVILATQFIPWNLFKSEEKIPMLEMSFMPDFRIKKNAFKQLFGLTEKSFAIENSLNVLHMDNPNPFKMKFRDGQVRTVTTLTQAVVAQAFTESEDIGAICACKDSQEILLKFNEIKDKVDKTWNGTYFIVEPGQNITETGMKVGQFYLFEALRAKFEQHPELLIALRQTGNDQLDHRPSIDFPIPFDKFAEMLYYFRQDPLPPQGDQNTIIIGKVRPRPMKQQGPKMLEMELIDFTTPITKTGTPDKFNNSSCSLHNDSITSPFEIICFDQKIRTFKCVTSFVLAHRFTELENFSEMADKFASMSAEDANTKATELNKKYTNEVWDHAYIDHSTRRQFGITNGQFWLWYALSAKFGQNPALIDELKKTGSHSIQHVNVTSQDSAFTKTEQFLYYIRGDRPPTARMADVPRQVIAHQKGCVYEGDEKTMSYGRVPRPPSFTRQKTMATSSSSSCSAPSKNKNNFNFTTLRPHSNVTIQDSNDSSSDEEESPISSPQNNTNRVVIALPYTTT